MEAVNQSDRRLRVLLIGRHFWPLGSFDDAGHLIDLATRLHQLGHHVEVVTPRQANTWSEQFQFREFAIHRPLRIFRSGWTSRGDRSVGKYIKSLRDWVCENHASADLIYCDGATEECVAAVESARKLNLPVVVRVAGFGAASDLTSSDSRRNVRRCISAARDADAVVVNSASVHRRMLSEGYNDAKFCRIPIGIGRVPDSSLHDKAELRTALAKINGDLHVFDTMSVVLSVERMCQDSGLMKLVQSARILSERIPGLQYWMIGDGPKRDSIFHTSKAKDFAKRWRCRDHLGSSATCFKQRICWSMPGMTDTKAIFRKQSHTRSRWSSRTPKLLVNSSRYQLPKSSKRSLTGDSNLAFAGLNHNGLARFASRSNPF
ncbi:hypothetical protein C2E31_22810 [Rhodopirellula baltica]|nr:hypothetical protein C2E31_22810 [Rhodopirellula baltica]